MLLVIVLGINRIRTLFNCIKKSVNLIGGSLSVIIKCYADISVGIPEACHKSRVLSEIAREIDSGDMGIR